VEFPGSQPDVPLAGAFRDPFPHPRYRGDWLLKPTRGAPFGLWYRDRAHGVSYAEWVAREVDCAEIIVSNRDGTLAERRVVFETDF
jgi:hypothetical protein